MSWSGVGVLRPLPVLSSPGGRGRRLVSLFSRAPAPPVWVLPDDELARLPRDGALLVLADRALAGEALERALVLLRRARPDLRPAPRAPWIGGEAREDLAAGGALLAAGAVSRPLRLPRWRSRATGRFAFDALARLARDTEACVVALHAPRPRRADDRPATLRLGEAIPAEALAALPSEAARRARIGLALAAVAARAGRSVTTPGSVGATAAPKAGAPAPVVVRGEAAWMEREIEALSRSHVVVPHERFAVVAARAPEMPALLQEIGRLREITFRAAGEGTGRAVDLDTWDRTYVHVFAWDRQARELAGAYRLGEAARLLGAFGPPGLYTSTLFDYRPGFFEGLGPAVELGRSFVRPEYQRSSGTLLLLWKAIARWVASQPAAPVLFGAVSVSARYGAFSRALVASALGPSGDAELRSLARLVAPRRPAPGLGRDVPGAPDAAALGDDLGSLSAIVQSAEPDGAPLPVLVREYAKLGGRFLAWNVDPDFGDTLDGLVVVDLARSTPRLLEFYMGRERAAAFREARALQRSVGQVAMEPGGAA